MFDLEQKYCPSCGMVGIPRVERQGSVLVFLVLLIIFFPAAILYGLWDHNVSKQPRCSKCKNPGMIPLDTPIARRALAISNP